MERMGEGDGGIMRGMRRLRFASLAPVLLVATLFVGCDDADIPLSDLEGTQWVLLDVAGQPAVASPTATLEFTEPGAFGGHSACNNFGGTIQGAGDRLRVTELMQTLTGCQAPIGEQETRYLEALLGAKRLEFKDDDLLIFSDAFDAPLRFRRADE